MSDLVKYEALLSLPYQAGFSASVVGLYPVRLTFKLINQGVVKALLELMQSIKLLNKRPLINHHF